MSSIDGVQKRGLREGPLGKALALLAVLTAAFLVARSCGSSQGAISKDEAIQIAREEIAWKPEGVQVKNVAQGIPQRRVWAVSLYNGPPTRPEKVTIVQIHSETGEVLDLAGPRS